MKAFNILVKLRATEGHRTHSADIQAESLEVLIASMNENLSGKFFALKAKRPGLLSEGSGYVVIINSAEVSDIIIVEAGETSTTSATLS